MKAERKKAVHRRRRIIVNNDGGDARIYRENDPLIDFDAITEVVARVYD